MFPVQNQVVDLMPAVETVATVNADDIGVPVKIRVYINDCFTVVAGRPMSYDEWLFKSVKLCAESCPVPSADQVSVPHEQR